MRQTFDEKAKRRRVGCMCGTSLCAYARHTCIGGETGDVICSREQLSPKNI